VLVDISAATEAVIKSYQMLVGDRFQRERLGTAFPKLF